MVADTDVPINKLATRELSATLERCEARIQRGQASHQDYLNFIACQLELAKRGGDHLTNVDP